MINKWLIMINKPSKVAKLFGGGEEDASKAWEMVTMAWQPQELSFSTRHWDSGRCKDFHVFFGGRGLECPEWMVACSLKVFVGDYVCVLQFPCFKWLVLSIFFGKPKKSTNETETQICLEDKEAAGDKTTVVVLASWALPKNPAARGFVCDCVCLGHGTAKNLPKIRFGTVPGGALIYLYIYIIFMLVHAYMLFAHTYAYM